MALLARICLLFGLSSSVVDFMRWSAFFGAAARRVAALLHATYVDDGSMGDFGLAKGSGQALLNVLFSGLGASRASAKQRRMVATGAFLGVDHDVSLAFFREGVQCLSGRRRSWMSKARACFQDAGLGAV